jgi:hypothetical protein
MLCMKGAKKDVRKALWEMKEGDLNKTWGFDYRTVVGSQSMHLVWAVVHETTSL